MGILFSILFTNELKRDFDHTHTVDSSQKRWKCKLLKRGTVTLSIREHFQTKKLVRLIPSTQMVGLKEQFVDFQPYFPMLVIRVAYLWCPRRLSLLSASLYPPVANYFHHHHIRHIGCLKREDSWRTAGGIWQFCSFSSPQLSPLSEPRAAFWTAT